MKTATAAQVKGRFEAYLKLTEQPFVVLSKQGNGDA